MHMNTYLCIYASINIHLYVHDILPSRICTCVFNPQSTVCECICIQYIYVQHILIQELRSADSNGLSDPYVVLYLSHALKV